MQTQPGGLTAEYGLAQARHQAASPGAGRNPGPQGGRVRTVVLNHAIHPSVARKAIVFGGGLVAAVPTLCGRQARPVGLWGTLLTFDLTDGANCPSCVELATGATAAPRSS